VPELDDTGRSRDEILLTIGLLLAELLDEEDLVDEVTVESTFGADLDLESILFVVLCERLQERYGEVDFVGWLADLEMDQLINLKVGDLVEHIARCLTS